jgi:broad specificity phosphatase PhoE
VPASRDVLFITHANVEIDPSIPVTAWPLSELGRKRHHLFNASDAVTGITAVYRSAESKAHEGAEILAGCLGVQATTVEALHENDRSATGFLPPSEFQATVNQFFAHPTRSIHGWERAVDAQDRIVSTIRTIVDTDRTLGHIAIVAHGGVGALLLCHLFGAAISREYDQPGSTGGCYFRFDVGTWGLIHGWRDISAGRIIPA